MTSILIYDTVRVCILGLSVLITVLFGVIIFYYKKIYSKEIDSDNIDIWQIVGLSISYIILVITASTEIALRIGTNLTWRTPLVLFAFGLGVYHLNGLRNALLVKVDFFRRFR